MYITRAIEKTITKAKEQFCCITIYGARQVGKTTLIKHILGDKASYVSLDHAEARLAALSNPRAFLESYSLPLVIDEIQRAPNLTLEIKLMIDEAKLRALENDADAPLMFVLSGSNQTELKRVVGDSLAGRTAILHLSSLSYSEINKSNSFSIFNPNIDVLKGKARATDHTYRTREEIMEDIFKGGMPEYINRDIERKLFFNSYLETYLEKDIRPLIKIENEMKFLQFLHFISLRTGCQIEYSSISNALGISVDTVKKWISLLITTGIVFLLEPYMKDVSKRIIKTPKLYFLDTGLCCFLAKIPSSSLLLGSVFVGQFYETYVVSEIYKSLENGNIDPSTVLFYYRDFDQKEVDLIYESFDGLYPIEIKKGLNPVSFRKNFSFLSKYGKPILHGLVIDSIKDITPINENVSYCPISLIGK